MTNNKTMEEKPIKIYTDKLGRKRMYIGIMGEKSAYPVVYFRKSKLATEKEFKLVLQHIIDNL